MKSESFRKKALSLVLFFAAVAAVFALTRITALAGQSGDKLVPADLTLKKRAGAENCYDFSAALLTATDSTAAAQVSGTITMVKEDGRWKASAITLNL